MNSDCGDQDGSGNIVLYAYVRFAYYQGIACRITFFQVKREELSVKNFLWTQIWVIRLNTTNNSLIVNLVSVPLQ